MLTTVARAVGQRLEPLAGQRTGAARYFFVALGAFYVLVAIAGFLPSYIRYFAGTRDIHWVAHLHGAVMSAWLLLFVIQSSLAASGSLRLHRTLGFVGTAVAGVVWASMCVAMVRVRVALNPPVSSFLWDVLLIELLLVILLPIFVTCGVRARRVPLAHKRFMVFAFAVPLQAAIDRIRWLPDLGLPRHWDKDFYVYGLLLPLVVFDILSSGRVHRVTAVGFVTVVLGHVVVNLFWGSAAWHRAAFAAFSWFR
jgi:hypothetical protein